MDIKALQQIAKQMVAPGRGILAADESSSTIEKKFSKINLQSTEDSRRAYREMLFTTPKMEEFISGVIMYDETFRQSGSDGKLFVALLQEKGVLPGIKVDEGTAAMEGSPNEKVTKGLQNLPPRLKEYAALGAKFAKWRAVITIDDAASPMLPTKENIRQNAKDLASYALMCQEAGIVPMVEPEVLMDGKHSFERCKSVSEAVLKAVFEELDAAGVAIDGMILKTNMIVPGSESGQEVTYDDVAASTLEVFEKILPKTLPGQAFLSGGQSDVDATQNLNAINKKGPFIWNLTFSYGRALQDAALKKWDGKPENVAAAQLVFYHRARMNSQASLGRYTGE
jgi:fructose-bisphosphate aldolase class I